MDKNLLIADFVRNKRTKAGLTQVELAAKSGVGLRLVRDIEQGKQSFRTDAVNKVLKLFGACLGPVNLPRN
ncbi:MAG: helix-turn-helix transcriptional regulator [Elusimicrobia bacterium]|nr:helix-turn-helix transcriptional regulator [Elusimicrobiota bacterium]